MAPRVSAPFCARRLAWVQHQRCVWHIWRNLAGRVGARGRPGRRGRRSSDVAEAVREQVRAELVALIHAVIDAKSYEQAEAALVTLRSHPQGAAIGQFLNEHLDRILVHLVAYYAGLQRVTPGVVLAGLPPPPQPRPQSWLRPSVWSGPPWSGPSTTTSSRPNGGLNANAIIAIPAKAPCKWPAHHPARSAISMLWACERPRNRRSCPETGEERRKRSPGRYLTQLRTNTAIISPTQDGTESAIANRGQML